MSEPTYFLTLTISNTNTLENGTPCRFTTTGTMDSAFEVNRTYYLRRKDTTNDYVTFWVYPTLADCLAETNRMVVEGDGTFGFSVHILDWSTTTVCPASSITEITVPTTTFAEGIHLSMIDAQPAVPSIPVAIWHAEHQSPST